MIARNELKGNVGYSISCESCLNMLKNRDRNRKVLVQEYLFIDTEYLLSGVCLKNKVI